jgi:hypothetical protein
MTIRIGHPYRTRAPDAPSSDEEPGPRVFSRDHRIRSLFGALARGEPLSSEQAELFAELRRNFPAWTPLAPAHRPPGGVSIETAVVNGDAVAEAIERIRDAFRQERTATRLGSDARASRKGG